MQLGRCPSEHDVPSVFTAPIGELVDCDEDAPEFALFVILPLWKKPQRPAFRVGRLGDSVRKRNRIDWLR